MSDSIFGFEVEPSEFGPRGCLQGPEVTGTGNIVYRAGREYQGTRGFGWEQVAHVVMTPEEAVAQAMETLIAVVGEAEPESHNLTTADVLQRFEQSLDATNVISKEFRSHLLGWLFKAVETSFKAGREVGLEQGRKAASA